MNFSERLQKLMAKRDLNQKGLVKATGLGKSTISMYLSGHRSPGPNELLALATFFGTSVEYLLTGDAKKQDAPPVPKNWGGPYWGTSDMAPVVSWASAGNAHAFEDQGEDVPRVKTSCKDPNCYALELDGDSMEPMYSAGDVLIIAPNMQYYIKDLVVFKTVREESYFKQYLGHRDPYLRFASYNPKYPVMDLRPEEIIKVHVVHSVIRPLKGKIF